MFRQFFKIPRKFGSANYATYRRFNNNTSYSNLLQDPRSLKYGGGIALIGGVFYITHLEPAPISGRRRFIFVSESIEKWVGQNTYSQIMAQYRGKILPQNDPTTMRVKRIMRRIINASDTSKDDDSIKWEIHVIHSNDPPNAFVIPGGKVFVFTSILPILHNDDGLATILSHEFSHQLARHSAENMSKAPIYLVLGLILYTITGSNSLNNFFIQSFLQMPLSREMETEADYIGLMLMSKACFDPHELSKVWLRFAEFEKRHGGGTLEFLSTHPSSNRRLHNMESWLHELELQRELGNCDNNLGGWFNDFKTTSGADIFGIDTSKRGGANGGLW